MSIQLYARIEKRPLHKSRVHKFPKSFVPTLPSIFHTSRTTCLLNIIEKVTKFDEFELTCRKERDYWIEGLIANEAVRFLFLNILFHLKYICNVLRGEVEISWGGRGEFYLVAVSEQYQKIIFDTRRNIFMKYINLGFSSPVSHLLQCYRMINLRH